MEFTGIRRAREIMGECFFDPEETARAFGLELTSQQADFFAQVPFTERMLHWRHKNKQCLLVPVPALALCHARVNTENEDKKWKLGWLRRETFIRQPGKDRWRLICNPEIDNLLEHNWRLEQTGIELDYFHYQPEMTIPVNNWPSLLPDAREMIIAILAAYLLKDMIIFSKIAATTSSVLIQGNSRSRFKIGPFNPINPKVDHLLGLEVHLTDPEKI